MDLLIQLSGSMPKEASGLEGLMKRHHKKNSGVMVLQGAAGAPTEIPPDGPV